MEVSEGIYNAAIAGHFGVPVAFVSGDREAVAQLKGVIPSVEGVVLKEGLGYHAAETVTPARSREMIQQGSRGGAEKNRDAAALSRENADRSRCRLQADARRGARLHFPRSDARLDAHSVAGTFPDIVQIARLMQVLTSLEPPP